MNEKMELIKYTKGGQQYEHDIHFTYGQNILRFGSNEDARPDLMRYFSELCRYAATEIAGLSGLIIKRIEWKRDQKYQSKTIKVSGHTVAKDGREVKVELPPFGQKVGFIENPATGEFSEGIIPIYCDMTAVEIIGKLEEELTYYAQHGAGQLEFNFAEEQRKEVNSMFQGQRREPEKVTAFPGR